MSITKTEGVKSMLSTLWIFATLNYLYCDVVTLMDPGLLKQFMAGNIGGVDVSQGFLLAAGALVEIPISMVVLARLLPGRANRWANIIAGALMTLVQLSTLAVKVPTPYYAFFSVIEIAATSVIVWYAWKWARDDRTAVSGKVAQLSKTASVARESGMLPVAVIR